MRSLRSEFRSSLYMAQSVCGGVQLQIFPSVSFHPCDVLRIWGVCDDFPADRTGERIMRVFLFLSRTHLECYYVLQIGHMLID